MAMSRAAVKKEKFTSCLHVRKLFFLNRHRAKPATERSEVHGGVAYVKKEKFTSYLHVRKLLFLNRHRAKPATERSEVHGGIVSANKISAFLLLEK